MTFGEVQELTRDRGADHVGSAGALPVRRFDIAEVANAARLSVPLLFA